MASPASHPGALVVSLDFELHWGLRDQLTVRQYEGNLLGVRQAIPGMLDLFRTYGVHATWATVGFLFFETRGDLLAARPARVPQYRLPRLSPYADTETIGANEEEDPFHFAPSLIRRIAAEPGQEIGTHTFSHYYCLEEGQELADFVADLRAASAAAQRLGLRLRSIVFPRNQVRADYLPACAEVGITAYRGNQAAWFCQGSMLRDQGYLKRAFRLADAYLPLAGGSSRVDASTLPANVPASRFLRPYSPSLRALETLRLQRIAAEMQEAAESGGLYHLWWHPHNFGAHTKQNLVFLESVLQQFARLRKRHGMESLNMAEAAVRYAPVGQSAAVVV